MGKKYQVWQTDYTVDPISEEPYTGPVSEEYAKTYAMWLQLTELEESLESGREYLNRVYCYREVHPEERF